MSLRIYIFYTYLHINILLGKTIISVQSLFILVTKYDLTQFRASESKYLFITYANISYAKVLLKTGE